MKETRLYVQTDLDLDHGSRMRAVGGWRGAECSERDLDDDSGFFHIELILDF